MNFENKAQRRIVIELLERKNPSKTHFQTALRPIFLDAHFDRNPSKTNLMRLLLWQAAREKMSAKSMMWLLPYAERARPTQWDEKDVYYDGRRLLNGLTERDASSDDASSESAEDESESASSDEGSFRGAPQTPVVADDTIERARKIMKTELKRDVIVTTRASEQLTQLVSNIDSTFANDRHALKRLCRENPDNFFLMTLARRLPKDKDFKDEVATLVLRACVAESDRLKKSQVQNGVIEAMLQANESQFGFAMKQLVRSDARGES